MGNGLSDYWKQKRAYEREQKVMKDLYIFVRALIDKKPSPSIILKEVKQMMTEMESIKNSFVDKVATEVATQSVTAEEQKRP